MNNENFKMDNENEKYFHSHQNNKNDIFQETHSIGDVEQEEGANAELYYLHGCDDETDGTRNAFATGVLDCKVRVHDRVDDQVHEGAYANEGTCLQVREPCVQQN